MKPHKPGVQKPMQSRSLNALYEVCTMREWPSNTFLFLNDKYILFSLNFVYTITAEKKITAKEQ